MKSFRQPGCLSLSPKVYSQSIPDGDAGVARTIQIMTSLAHGKYGDRSWPVRLAALDAARGTERGMDEISSVLDWVKRNIEFRGENGETLQSPEATLQARAGDCDCQSTLAAAMLGWLGYQTRFKTMALIDSPQELSHVYLEVRDKRTRQWVPLDATVARSWPGWEPDNVARSVTYAPTPAPSAGRSLITELLIGAGVSFAIRSLLK